MSLTPIWCAGAEFGLNEFTAVEGGSVTDSASFVRTGNYAFTLLSTQRTHIIPGSEYDSVRFACHVLLPLVGGAGGGAGNPGFFQVYNQDSMIFNLCYDTANDQFALWDNATSDTGEIARGDFVLEANTYHRIVFDMRLAASGWLTLYVDGTEVFNFQGDTAALAETINRIRMGCAANRVWSLSANYDDLAWFDTTGETGPGDVADVRLAPMRADAVGAYSQWTPSAEGDNYTMVDEGEPDADSTYVEAVADNSTDAYGMSDVTVPDGTIIAAVVPVTVQRKIQAVADVQVRHLLRLANDETSTDPQDVNSAYGAVQSIITTAPDGGTWTQEKVNALQVGIVSAGAFD